MKHRPKTVAIIPARFASTRFPGKPLALIAGKPMIRHVYERVAAAKSVDDVYVATDDKRVAEAVTGFGGKFIMTSSSLMSGTDRCAAAARKIGASIVVNVQGDEPVISPKTVDAAVSALLASRDNVMSTAAVPIKDSETLLSENSVKVVVDKSGNALYFTRATIPFLRGTPKSSYLSRFRFLKHLGIYIYRNEFLQKLTKLRETSLEKAEKLEQLRVLENGYRIRVAVVKDDTISVDIPSDIHEVETYLSKLKSRK